METIVAPNINVVRRGGQIGSIAKLGSESSGVSTKMNLSQSLALLTVTTKVVGVPQMVFTSLMTTTHGNKIVGHPLMSSMAIRGCKM